MVQRLTLRRRLSYNTRSNRRKITRTPGGKLVYLHIKKRTSIPICGDTKTKLKGVSGARPNKLKNMCKRKKTVTRAYGGSRCHKAVKERIIRSFLIEEQRIVAQVLKAAAAKTAAAEKLAAKS